MNHFARNAREDNVIVMVTFSELSRLALVIYGDKVIRPSQAMFSINTFQVSVGCHVKFVDNVGDEGNKSLRSGKPRVAGWNLSRRRAQTASH
jgi:hypothetical protein